MPQKKTRKTCPECRGDGKTVIPGRGYAMCPTCDGQGEVVPVFQHYPINLTVTQTVPGTQPVLTAIGAPNNPLQTGTNPAVIRLANEHDFELTEIMLEVTSPTVIGDAGQWVQFNWQDLKAQHFFMPAPVNAHLFGGTGQLPFPELETYRFTNNTQLQFQGYPFLLTGLSTPFGTGDGTTTSFGSVTSMILTPPVLPGSVVVTDAAGTVIGKDTAGNGILSGTGVSGGSVNYATGAIQILYSVAPLAGYAIAAAYSMGCALINVQIDLFGYLLVKLTKPQKSGQMAA